MKLHNFKPETNAHALMLRHLERHQYKKGTYEGAAPADKARRGKTHYRIERRNNGDMAVVFHYTDIIRALPDGTLILRTNGYSQNPTTRAAFSRAVLSFTPWRMQLTTITLNGYTNICLSGSCLDKPVAFEEGMIIRPDGTIDNFGAKLYRYEADRAARKAWRNDPQHKAFRELLPILFEGAKASATQETWRRVARCNFGSIHCRLEALQDSENWPDLIQWLAHQYNPCDYKQAWREAFEVPATRQMRIVVEA